MGKYVSFKMLHIYSINVISVKSWNKIEKLPKNMPLKDLSPNKITTVVSNFYQLIINY